MQMRSLLALFLLFLNCSCALFQETPRVFHEQVSKSYKGGPSSKVIMNFNRDRSSIRNDLGTATLYNLKTGETILSKSLVSNPDDTSSFVEFFSFSLNPGVYALVEYSFSDYSYDRSSSGTVVLDIEEEAPWFVVTDEDKYSFYGTVSFLAGSRVAIQKNAENQKSLDKLLETQGLNIKYDHASFIQEDEEKIRLTKIHKLSKVNFD